MLRKLLVIIFCSLITIVFAQELGWQDINNKIYNISNNYQKGKAREVMKAYAPAVDSYIQSLQESNELLGNSRLSKEQIMDILPYTIASSYRLAIATEKMVNGQMTYLYDQVERYKQAHELVTQTLANISSLRIDRKMEITDSYYGHLYYARALLNNGMAYTLANGTLWQRYFIYMPSDIVLIIGSVKADLEHYLFLNKINERNAIENSVKLFTENIIDNSYLDKILKLSYYLENKDELKPALRQRYENIFNYLDRINQNKDFFRQISEIKNYETYEKSELSKRFIEETKATLDLLKN